jgi:hypothetical protein
VIAQEARQSGRDARGSHLMRVSVIPVDKALRDGDRVPLLGFSAKM